MANVAIRGNGIAASACAHLLNAAGFCVSHESAERVAVPGILLSPGTQKLIGDVFEREHLFDGSYGIESRIVAWGKTTKPLRVPHSAVVVSAHQLERIAPLPETAEPACHPDWTVLASRPLPLSTIEYGFGSRVAFVRTVRLKEGSDSAACWIESLECGWLFLIPANANTGWLLSVGAADDTLLADSGLIAREIDSFDGASGQFPAYPRIADPLCGTGWLACGSAALAFDPLCGDGTGNAVREAILAAAVIRAVAQGADCDGVLLHYRSRLVAGFAKHLGLCRQFYASGHGGPWWDAELESVDKGLEWCRRELDKLPDLQYRLEGFELRRI